MKQYAFMFFLISGFCTLWPCPALQYHLVEDEKSWSDAQSFCRQNYTDLVTLYRGQEALLPQSSRDVWIGLRGAWQWSLAHPDLYQEAQDSPLNWREGEPNNIKGLENCALMGTEGKFHDVQCSQSLYFICYKEGQTPEYFPISHQNLNWTEAQRYCKDQNYTGLAVSKNTEEYKRMHESIESPNKRWWIGLSKIWMWSDQSQFSHHNWKKMDKEGKDPICTAVGSSGKWKKDDCSEEKPFYCYNGSCTLWPCPALQYHLVEDEKSWSDAQSFCRQNYADLATLYRGQEALLPQSSRDAWIGLRRTWQWSLAHPDLYQEAEESSLIWAKGESNNKGGHETCAVMRKDGTFNDVKCSVSILFICYKEGQTPEYFPISHQNLNWTEAQRYCKDQNYTGLAVSKNKEEYKKMHESIESPNKRWWIGLSKIWMWSDQSQFSYHNWDDTTDDRTYPICTAVGSSGNWKEDECSKEKPFYCYDDDLILVRENRTWDEALDYCRRNHSDLVSVYTESLQHWVKRRAQQASTDHVWLGLRFSCALRYWHWVNADGVCYQNWASQNLQDKCGHMGAIESHGGQKWHKLPKTERLNFICSKRA
ncbi:hypothetical protein GJAV_G00090940 [Gymnothorax javanicus]|nr:hypothetical protein GJAV_G00090940 [Gymnothorax javanicus]